MAVDRTELASKLAEAVSQAKVSAARNANVVLSDEESEFLLRLTLKPHPMLAITPEREVQLYG